MCAYSQKECACIGGQNELALILGQRKSVQNINQCVFPRYFMLQLLYYWLQL